MFLMNNTLPNLRSTVRFLHAATGTEEVDLYANGELLASKVSFSDITGYLELAPGKYEIQIFKSGTYDTPVFSDDITLLPNELSTICVCLLESNLILFTLKDGTTNKNTSDNFLRFINLSPTAPLLTLSLPGGDTLFNGVEYLETTGYTPLSAGIYNFLLTATDASAFRYYIKDLDLKPGNFHTLYIIGQVDSDPKLGSLFVQDGAK